MSVERPAFYAESKKVNMNEILRNSYLFSQGKPELQRVIFEWLAVGPLAHVDISDGSSSGIKRGMITKYAAGTSENGQHRKIETKPDEPHRDEIEQLGRFKTALQFRDMLQILSQDDPELYIKKLTRELISRDAELLTRRANLLSQLPDRDKNSSFFVDFGILHKGTSPWSWESIPEAYKQMWSEVVSYAKKSGQGTGLMMQEILSAYEHTHPEMSEHEKQLLKEFSSPPHEEQR